MTLSFHPRIGLASFITQGAVHCWSLLECHDLFYTDMCHGRWQYIHIGWWSTSIDRDSYTHWKESRSGTDDHTTYTICNVCHQPWLCHSLSNSRATKQSTTSPICGHLFSPHKTISLQSLHGFLPYFVHHTLHPKTGNGQWANYDDSLSGLNNILIISL